jgi:hypothetical protein
MGLGTMASREVGNSLFLADRAAKKPEGPCGAQSRVWGWGLFLGPNMVLRIGAPRVPITTPDSNSSC